MTRRGLGHAARRARTARPVAVWLVLTAALALLLAGCAPEGGYPQSALDPQGPVAQAQDRLWRLVFPVAVGIFILVEAGILYTVWRFRDRGGDDMPKQIHGNTRLEVLWTLIPALILAGVAVPTVRTIFELDAGAGDEALEVKVIAKQYWWEFEYLGDEGRGVVTANELHIPTNRPVQLSMVSTGQLSDSPDGVIHSFWVPQLAGKKDVIPGHEQPLTIEADNAGTYLGQCAEYCGLSHANMRFSVVAQEPAAFKAWLEEQAQPAGQPSEALAAKGQEIFGQSCVSCHTVKGHPQNADARWGPNLTHFNSRERFAGGTFDVQDDEQLRAWLQNPPGVKPGAQMPNLGLTPEQIDALVAYLRTLE